MAAKIAEIVKIQLVGGKASPAPPVGTILGPRGVNLNEFVTKFNDLTKDKMGKTLPTVITIYDNRSFDITVKQPSAESMIKEALNIQKGSGEPNQNKVGKLTRKQLEEIANTKMPDLNAHTTDAAMRIIAGTARSMGVDTEAV